MHVPVEDQQPSWSRRRVLFMGVVVIALVLAVVGVAVQGSAITQQLQLFRVDATPNLRTTSAADRTAADASATGTIDAVASSSSSVQANEQQDPIQSAHGSGQDQQNVLSSSTQDRTDASSTTETIATSSYQDTQQPGSGESKALPLHDGGQLSPSTSTDGRKDSQSPLPLTSASDASSQSAKAFHYDQYDENPIPTSTEVINEYSTPQVSIRVPSVPLLGSGFETPIRDPALPPAVHALWIGDSSRAPDLNRYRTAGFELTIHNDVDNILEGFAPHVRAAYGLAIPRVVGFDFLKLLMLYKYGGLVVDADTYPNVSPSQVQYSSDCHVLFGKEAHLDPWQFSGPTYRRAGGNTYGLSRPYQLLNWAMLAREPRNTHIAALIDGAMQHFYGLRDVDESLVQDIAGSGLMSDYVALLYAENGLDYVSAFNTPTPPMDLQAVDGFCMLEHELRDGWIHHEFMNTWRQE